jgi:hypothetical protein
LLDQHIADGAQLALVAVSLSQQPGTRRSAAGLPR